MHRVITKSIAVAALGLSSGVLLAHSPARATASSQESALEAAYKRLQTRLNAYQREKLGRSQEAWVRFRDAQCDFEASVLIGGPLGIEERAQSEMQSRCVTRETRSRTQALKADFGMSWDGTR